MNKNVRRLCSICPAYYKTNECHNTKTGDGVPQMTAEALQKCSKNFQKRLGQTTVWT